MEIEHHKWPSIKDWISRMAKPWGISINFIEGHEWCSIHWVRVMTALITLLSIQGISTRRWSLLLSQQKNREITEFTTCKRFEFVSLWVWHIKTRQIKSGNEKSKQSKKTRQIKSGIHWRCQYLLTSSIIHWRCQKILTSSMVFQKVLNRHHDTNRNFGNIYITMANELVTPKMVPKATIDKF